MDVVKQQFAKHFVTAEWKCKNGEL